MRWPAHKNRGLSSAWIACLTLAVAACAQENAPAAVTSSPSATSPSPSAAATVETLATTTEPADEAPPGATVITVGPGAVMTPADLTVDAAETVTFFLDTSNVDEGIHHNMKIGPAMPPALPLAESESFDRDQSVVFTVTGLEPGSYRFWCSVDAHYEYGMHGTLTVE